MAEGFVQVTEGTGKKLHTFERTVGANDVHDEVMILGEPILASYTMTFTSVGLDTQNEHIVQIMAGSSLPVRVRKIALYQQNLGAADTRFLFEVRRVTSAGTGGASVTPNPMDPSDAAAGATSQTRPTSKGTEGVIMLRGAMRMLNSQTDQQDWEWYQLPQSKPILLPAGTSNGLVIKQTSGAEASASVRGFIEFDEGYA